MEVAEEAGDELCVFQRYLFGRTSLIIADHLNLIISYCSCMLLA